MRVPSYDDLTPSIPDVSPADVFEATARVLPPSTPDDRGRGTDQGPSEQGLYACLRSTRVPDVLAAVAADVSPRRQRHGADAIVLDVSGLGRLLGPPAAIAREIAQLAADRAAGDPRLAPDPDRSRGAPRPASRYVSRYGLRIEPHPSELGRICGVPDASGSAGSEPEDGGAGNGELARHDRKKREDLRGLRDLRGRGELAGRARGMNAVPEVARERAVAGVLHRAGIRIAVAPTQAAALLLTGGAGATPVVALDAAPALAPLPVQALQQLIAGEHGGAVRRRPRRAEAAAPLGAGWPAWEACERAFDMLPRWGIATLGGFAALPPGDVSARMGPAGVALQRLARGLDLQPLVPDPDARRFRERMDLEWPIDGLEPLSFVLARLLDPLASALERADRAAAALRLELRLVDRTTHARLLQLPVAMRDARVLRTLLLLDLESHPPAAAIDVVTLELDPAPGRIVQYSLLERALPSPETLATLTARLNALAGESRCGTPVVLDTHRPDAFEMRRLDAQGLDGRPRPPRDEADPTAPCLRRFRPPVAVRVRVERGRPAYLAIDRRGMPGGPVRQAAGPWRSSGAWWTAGDPWDRDEWDVELQDGAVCRLFRARPDGGWFLDGVVD